MSTIHAYYMNAYLFGIHSICSAYIYGADYASSKFLHFHKMKTGKENIIFELINVYLLGA